MPRLVPLKVLTALMRNVCALTYCAEHLVAVAVSDTVKWPCSDRESASHVCVLVCVCVAAHRGSDAFS